MAKPKKNNFARQLKATFLPKRSNRKVTDLDTALLLIAVSAVFGIITQRVPVDSLFGLIFSGFYAFFWGGMAFSSGRNRKKGFWITACVLWGITLAFFLLNLNNFAWLTALSDTALAPVVSFVSVVLLLVNGAVFMPLVTGLNYLHLLPGAAMGLLWLCLGCMATLAALFVAGILYERSEPAKRRKARLEQSRNATIDWSNEIKD